MPNKLINELNFNKKDYDSFDKNPAVIGYVNDVAEYAATLVATTPGPAGPQGIAGNTGPAGVPGPVGPAGLTWRSTWVSGTSYILNDAVGYAGASYYCILATSGTTTPNLATSNWALLASQGAQGPQGLTGLQGPTGATGPTGASGSIPNLEFFAASKSVWNNGQGNIATNTSFGEAALGDNTTGTENTAFGQFSLGNNIDGIRNTGVGTSTLLNNLSGNSNTAIGSGALYSNNASDNTAVGFSTLSANQSGAANTAIGQSAMFSNNSGNYNIAIGLETLGLNVSSSNNVAIGNGALALNTVAGNLAIGSSALYSNTTGNYNTSVGTFSSNLITGSGNTVLGYNASGDAATTTGSFNTVIGYNADSKNFSGGVVLGASAVATANNQFVIGSTAYNAGAVTTETPATTTRTWTVRVNGVNYKIPMYVA